MEALLHLPVVPDIELVAAKTAETLGRAVGLDQTRVEAVSVAVVEACLNAMEHGGGPVTVRMTGSPSQLEVEVEDHGCGFDPDREPGQGPTRVQGCVTKRGWGLTLIRELMDEVQIRSRPGETVVRMCKYVGSGS